MDRTLKALSLILSYPSGDLQEAMPAIADQVASDPRLPLATRAALEALAYQLAHSDLYDLQERYVMLFDRSRTLSLNLFEHVHGESRERGGAMVSLIETYREVGFEPATSELPDHLPVLLEFLSTRTEAEARDILADAVAILAALADRLARRDSDYGAVLAALVACAEAEPSAEATAALAEFPDDDPEDLEALDATYAEAQVMFGPDPNAGCPAVRDVLARMDLPAAAPPAAAAR